MTKNMNNKIDRVKNWLEKVVIGENFCPFAKKEFVNNSIRYEFVDLENLEQKLLHLIDEFEFLDKNPSTETTLLIYGESLKSFDDFLNFVDIAHTLMAEQNYEGVYQLATFHPDYCFAGVKADDASNFTNRSPYPILHIIKEESLELAIAGYPNVDRIPERNIKKARELGSEYFKNILKEYT